MKLRWNALTLSRVLALSLCTTGLAGCKTASWMPGSKLLAWNRDPDPSMLASEPIEPQSPANKYEPTSIASMGKPTGTAASLAQSRAGGLAASANGYGSPYASATTPTGSTGYSTGPYQTGSTATGGGQSPYGGSYSSAPSNQPDVALPSSVASNLGTGSAYPTSTVASNTTPGVTSSGSNAMGAGLPAYPVASSGSGFPTPASTAGYSSNATASSGLPTPPLPGGTYPTAGSPMTSNLPSAGSLQSSLPNMPLAGAAGGPSLSTGATGTATAPTTTAPAGGFQAPSAYKGATTLGGFSPGSTGRSTGYDFGSGPSGSSGSLPPNTAGGAGSLLR